MFRLCFWTVLQNLLIFYCIDRTKTISINSLGMQPATAQKRLLFLFVLFFLSLCAKQVWVWNAGLLTRSGFCFVFDFLSVAGAWAGACHTNQIWCSEFYRHTKSHNMWNRLFYCALDYSVHRQLARIVEAHCIRSSVGGGHFAFIAGKMPVDLRISHAAWTRKTLEQKDHRYEPVRE